jgi:hypothetical protein
MFSRDRRTGDGVSLFAEIILFSRYSFFTRLLLFGINIVQHARYFTFSQDGIEYFCFVSGSINENAIPCYDEKKILITSCRRLFKR